ncbi:uncharacterized protein LOC132740014 [Ruditapes philippinarum]|uniref:uncharacterized protein LOC132740014 n=1 Tax=Ruditapes philippinarum TaxID=129788 RepID=UPI00295AC6D7|nr:uncharacterized protein LOC132740014 [Ruditapes philippinarum]
MIEVQSGSQKTLPKQLKTVGRQQDTNTITEKLNSDNYISAQENKVIRNQQKSEKNMLKHQNAMGKEEMEESLALHHVQQDSEENVVHDLDKRIVTEAPVRTSERQDCAAINVTNPFNYSADNVHVLREPNENTCTIDEPNMSLSNTWQACQTAMRAVGGHTTDSRITAPSPVDLQTLLSICNPEFIAFVQNMLQHINNAEGCDYPCFQSLHHLILMAIQTQINHTSI